MYLNALILEKLTSRQGGWGFLICGSPDLQSALLLFNFLHLLFCCRLPGHQAVNDHYKLNGLFWLKRKPKRKITGAGGGEGSIISCIGKDVTVKGMILGGEIEERQLNVLVLLPF